MGIAKNRTPVKPVWQLELQFERYQIYRIGLVSAPLWMWRLGPWRRAVAVHWRRLDDVSDVWWVAQHRCWLVVVGRGVRPALSLSVGDWHAVVPAGYQSSAIKLPGPLPCSVRAWPTRVGQGP